MSTDLRSQRWQDPEELPRYLNDSLEQSSVMFSTGISYGAGILTALMGSDSDFIIDVDQYAEQIAAKSFSALSWSTVNYVSDLDDLFAGRLQVKSRRQFVALLLREFEAAVRETWFQIAKANDPRAQAAEDTGIATREAHKEQILYLSERFGLADQDRDLWLTLPGAGGLSKQVHHRFVRSPSRGDIDELEAHHMKVYELLKKLTQAVNSEYGWAVAYLARLLDGGPAKFDIRSKKAGKYLQQSIPDNRRLRAWFLAQVPGQEWIVPLARARFLGVGPDDLLACADDGTATAPTVHGLRMLIRIVEGLEKPQRPGRAVCAVEFAAPATVAAIETVVDEWLPEQAAPLNPRAHTDIAELLIRLGKAADATRVDRLLDLYGRNRYYSKVTRLVGDRGVIRFPLQIARLASHLSQTGHRHLSEEAADATRIAVSSNNSDKDIEFFAKCCERLVPDRRVRRRLVKR